MIMIIDNDHDHRDHEFVVRRTMRDMKNKAVAVESMELRGRGMLKEEVDVMTFKLVDVHVVILDHVLHTTLI